MAFEKNDNHVQEAIDRLPSQFSEKEKIAGLIEALVQPLQDAEDCLSDMATRRWVETATGDTMDRIGDVVGEQRKGRGDAEYRVALLARIAINTSRGVAEDAINVFNLLTGSTKTHLLEYFPGHVEIFGNIDFSNLVDQGPESFAFFGGSDGLGFGTVYDASIGGEFASLGDNFISQFYTIIDSVLAGGVRLDFLGWFDADEPFSFDGDDAGFGFGTIYDSTIGGKFATVIPPP